jgi:hypothetical protein
MLRQLSHQASYQSRSFPEMNTVAALLVLHIGMDVDPGLLLTPSSVAVL